MAVKLVHIIDSKRAGFLKGCPADAFAVRNADARGFSLEWSKHQLLISDDIQAQPVDVGDL